LTDYVEGVQSMLAKVGAAKGDPAPRLDVAELHLTERRWQDALRMLARAESVGADPARVACVRAEAYYGAGALALGDEGVVDAEKAISARPPGAADKPALAARLALARAAGAVAKKETSAALSLLQAARGPGAPDERLFHMRIADAYLELGRSEEAEASYRRAESHPRLE
jgi:tetratricopeptide (TPR) repeat protein